MSEPESLRPSLLSGATRTFLVAFILTFIAALWTCLELTGTRSMFLVPLGAGLQACALGIVSVFAGYLAMHRIRGMIFLERVVLGFAAGLAGLVMAVFLAGVAGIMHPALMNMVLPSLSALMILFRAKWVVAKTQDEQKPIKALRVFAADFGPADWVLVGMIVVLSTVVLYGAAAPCVEYDTMEYHAAIPAEWHRAGGIVDLPHNVYSYFPMAVEMLYFAGISWVNDVALGAMVGKILAASCTVWAALALVCVGRRLFTLRAGLIAAVFYLTVPWVLRVSILGFVEGVQSFYVAAALLCTVVLWQRGDEEAGQDRRSIGPALLLGVIVGMTLGIKLTSAVFILPPILVLCFSALATRRIGWRALAAFAIATAAFGSPFYIRDLVLTGNPFFPVLSTWLGGPAGWTDEMARHFTEHHSAGAMTWRALTASLVGVQDAPPNTWPSFLFGGAVLLAAPFSLANRRWRRSAATLLVIVVVAVATWFCLTHRIMRHLAPAWVLLAMTGGAGLVAFRATWARWVLAVAVALHLGMTFMVDQRMLQDRGTYVSLLADAAAPMTDSGYAFTYHPDSTDRLWTYSPHVVRMINDLKRGRKFPPVIGLVGEARTLYFDVPVVYNTVFNRHWMEPLYREAARPDELKARALRLFQELGTTHVYINWAEVDRFRAPGNYGWPDGLDRDLFDRLEAAGVLNRILAVGRPEEPPLHVVYEVGSPH